MKEQSYQRLGYSLCISFVVMYIVMFLNVDEASHIYLSLNRLYMALLMVSPMAMLMITLMGGMYLNKKKNNVILLTSIVVFCVSLFCLRKQAFISDEQYMRGMIPHHSSAIMTSKHASIRNERVRALADSIIKSQQTEIKLMKSLIEAEE